MPEDELRRTPAVRVTTRPPTAAESAVYDRAVRAAGETIPTLNDFLGRLVTLNSALIGGGFVVAKGDVLPVGWAVATLVGLFVSLGAALYGLLPTRGYVNPHAVNGVPAYQRYEEGVVRKKGRMMWVAAVGLAAAFAIGIIGLATR